MKRLLITGGCGFIGTNFIKNLIETSNEKLKITIIDNLSHGVFIDGIHNYKDKNIQVKFLKRDIRSKSIVGLFKWIDVVYHFAGLVSIYDCDKDHRDALDNNIMGSVNVLDSCIKHRVKKVVVMETSAVYEDCGKPPYNEHQSNPRTIYATSKAMLSSLVKSYNKLYKLNYTLIRPFNVYGEFQDWKRTVPPASAGFAIRLLLDKKPIIFGDVNRRRDFIHVDDICSFLKICLNDEKTNNETFNLGVGKSTSLEEMIKEIATILNKPYNGFIQMPEINGEAFDIYANNEKARKLGWEPKVSFKEGHTRLIGYLKENASLFPSDFMDDIDVNKIKI